MNRMMRTLLDITVAARGGGYDIDNRHISDINGLFCRMDSGSDEQMAYFPFNQENPIWKKRGLLPWVRSMRFSAEYNCVTVDGYLSNADGEICMDIALEFDLDDQNCLGMDMLHVWNDKVADKNKGQNIGAHYVNTLQNFLVYSYRPNQIVLITSEQGNYYWATWFDFDGARIAGGLKSFLEEYKRQFMSVVLTAKYLIKNKVREKDLGNAVRDFRYPIQFRYVNRELGGDDTMGKVGMKYSCDWHGKCSLYELSENNPIRGAGMDVMAERGIRFEYPPDFDQMVQRQIKNKLR